MINRPLDRYYLQVIFYNSNLRAFQSTGEVINIGWNRQVRVRTQSYDIQHAYLQYHLRLTHSAYDKQ